MIIEILKHHVYDMDQIRKVEYIFPYWRIFIVDHSIFSIYDGHFDFESAKEIRKELKEKLKISSKVENLD